jgi:flagellar hook assembly protein FlgD
LASLTNESGGIALISRGVILRKSVVVLVFAMLAALGAFVPVASAAPAGPRVVIIVGATHDATPGYRADANAAYAEAIKYTSNVVKVYSPNATWSKVKAAVKGASIVVYFGHGNGWPSPYTYDPKYTTKDGFGLNATAGNGDYNNKYYGEPYVSTLELAPNAVVLLSHLCYASGNSEPGDAAPSQTTARKRVSNFAAGFLKAGAQAVIADGRGGPEPYIRALFTTHATIEDAWQGAPNFHGHVSAFPSTRTPGATAYTDTDGASSGYYRSLVARPGLTTDEVTGATYADTGTDPTTLVVPGRAEVVAAGGGLFPDAALTPDGGTGQPPETAPAGTRLRTVAGGTGSVQVEGIDAPSLSGWMSVTDLRPRDSRGPQVWNVDTAGGRFSPNGDGRSDTAQLSGRFSETVAWHARILGPGGAVLHEATGSGDDFDMTWDGLGGGAPFPDGAYEYSIDAQDAWDNPPVTRTGTITIDTVPAQLTAVAPDGSTERWFAPNGDGSLDTASWTATTAEAGSIVWRVLKADGTEIRRTTISKAAGPAFITWDGRDGIGTIVPDGLYEISIHPRDVVGNQGTSNSRSVRVATTLGFVTSSKGLFYPQDSDRFAKTTSLGFKLTRAATVTWTIVDATGAVVATLLDAQPMAAGTSTRAFDGRRADGSRLKAGMYASVVNATDETATVSQAVAFQMNAFSIKASDTTPKRGQKISVTVTSAEPLSTRPRLFITQPGKTTWSVLLTKVSTYGYKATVTLRTGGKAGTVTFKVVGTDADGHRQRTSQAYAIH